VIIKSKIKNKNMNLIFNKFRAILTEDFRFHYDQLKPETKLELELGMDSREFLELLVNLEINFEIEVNFDEIDYLIKEEHFITIKDLVKFIEKKQFSKFSN